MEFRLWSSRGSKYEDKRWNKIPIDFFEAVKPPRPSNVWSRHMERAVMMQLVLARIGPSLPPMELTKFRGNIVEATRHAVLLYPTNASLRARLAEASAEIGMKGDAAKEGHEAIRLDDIVTDRTRKLDPKVRLWLEGNLPAWDEAAKEAIQISIPKSRRTP